MQWNSLKGKHQLMVILFLKIFFAGICIFCLWIFFKKISALIYPLWSNKTKLKLLNNFITNDIYDSLTSNRSIKSYIFPKCQESHPYKKENRKGPVKKTDLSKKLDIFLDHNVKCRRADSGSFS